MVLRNRATLRVVLYSLFAVPAFVIFNEVLFRGAIFADGDAVLQLYPALSFFKHALLTGDSYIWNPHVMTGFVTAAGLMGGFFSMLNQLVYQWLPVTSAYAWFTWFSFWMTSVATFEFSRKLGLRKITSVFTALTFPWVTANFIWAGNTTVTSGLFILPLLLYIILLFRDNFYRRNLLISIFAGIGIGTFIIPYHFQWTFQVLLMAGCWAIVLSFKEKRVAPVVWSCLLVLVTFAVALPQYYWLLKLIPYSARQGGIRWEDIQGGMLIPGDFLSIIFPNLSISGFLTHPGFLYIGSIPFLLCVISFLGKKNIYYKFFAFALAVSLLISIRYSPVGWLVHLIPGFSSFRELSRAMYVGIFSAIFLAAYGLEWVIASKDEMSLERVSRVFWRIALMVSGVFFIGSIIVNVYTDHFLSLANKYFDRYYVSTQLTFPPEHYYQVIRQIFTTIKTGAVFPNFQITMSIVFFLAGTALILHRQKLSKKNLAIGLTALASLNLCLIDYHQLSSRVAHASNLTSISPGVEYLLARADGDFRVWTLFSGVSNFDLLDTPYGYEPSDNVAFMSNLLTPNINILFGIDSLDYYDNLMDRRHARVLAYFGSDRATADSRLVDEDISLSKKIEKFLDRLHELSAYNVRYIISAYPLTHSDLSPVLTWNATSHHIPLYLYELTKFRPRYYLTDTIDFTDTDSESILWERTRAAIQEDRSLLECSNCPAVEASEGKWQLQHQTNSWYSFTIDTVKPQYFIFGQGSISGWRAFIDGQQTTIYPANFINQAILVSAGRHEVVFVYAQ